MAYEDWLTTAFSCRRRSQSAVIERRSSVLLAVDAMEHAARRNMQLAIFITGDLDFEPLLNSLLRLGIRTQLKYVPLQTSPELRAAADEIRKITLEHFFAWSAPSFRENHKQVKILYGERHPEPPIFEIAREGSWNGRKVLLYRPTNQCWPRLYVEPGNELTEPSYLFEYVDIDKLELAFELTFGKIAWMLSASLR